MPKISEFYGIVIEMFHREHAPPHFHATYAGDEMVVGIDPLRVLSGRMHPRARRMVFEWASLRQDELVDNWRLAERRGVLHRIEPLP